MPEERLLDGTVEAVNQATVSAQTAGRIDAMHVDVNDPVPAGTVIVRIRSTEQVAGLDAGAGRAQGGDRARGRGAERYQRIRDMYQRKVVARATFDEAIAARDAAVARLMRDAGRTRCGPRGCRVHGDPCAVRRRRDAEVRPGRRVRRTRHAADRRRVARRAAGRRRGPAERRRAGAQGPQGRRVRGRQAGRGDRAHALSVRRSRRPTRSASASTCRRTCRAWRPACSSRSGSSPASADLLLVPRAAIVERSEMRAVYVVAPDGRVSLRQVRLGRARGDQIEILAGLVAGERVARRSGGRGGAGPPAGARRMTEKLGFSGRIARLFLDSELTPLLGLTALLLGLFAVLVTPREEEPQINVTMANVIVPFPGASAAAGREPRRHADGEGARRDLRREAHLFGVASGRRRADRAVRGRRRTAPTPSSASTTPSIRTRTGARPASACCSRWSSRRASTTCRS